MNKYKVYTISDVDEVNAEGIVCDDLGNLIFGSGDIDNIDVEAAYAAGEWQRVKKIEQDKNRNN